MDVIPAVVLSGHFVQEKIISPEDQLEIFKVILPSNAAGLLLSKISFPLKKGNIKIFYQFLDITERYGNVDSKMLIDDIRKTLLELESKGD